MDINKLPSAKDLELLRTRMATQFQLPSAYDDALSYQGLIYKLIQYLKDTMQNVEDWNIWLEDFVSTFDTRLQDTVRSKIQELYDSGQLAELVAQVIDVIQNQIDDVNSRVDGVDNKIVETDNRLTTQLEETKTGLTKQLGETTTNLTKQLGETTTKIEDIGINVRKFGAVGDGVTDDSRAIQEANDYCLEHGLMMFSSSKHFLGKSVTINCNANLENAEFIFDGKQAKSLIIKGYGTGDTRVREKTIRLPRVINKNFSLSGYPTTEQTGVYIEGMTLSKVFFQVVEGFKNGFVMYSDHGLNSIMWSEFRFRFFINNETSGLLKQRDAGWINSNSFYDFGAAQNSNTNRTKNVQFEIDSEIAGATGVDNNTFVACDFECRVDRTVDTDAVIFKNMTNTTFFGCRWEVANKNVIKLDGGFSNIFIGGYNLNPAYIRELNDPKYTLIWQNRFTSNGQVVANGLTSNVMPIKAVDAGGLPLQLDNSKSATNSHILNHIANGYTVGEINRIAGVIAYQRDTRSSGGKYITDVNYGDRLKIIANERFDIQADNTLINNSHIQTVINCTSDNRPAMKAVGLMVFDTTLKKPIFALGNGIWVDANGTKV